MRPTLREVFCALYPSTYRYKAIVILQAVVDASHDMKDRRLTVAGFFAPLSVWCGLQEAWQGFRDRVGVPSIRMAAVMSRRVPPYSCWSDSDRHAFITEAMTLINATTFGLTVTLNLEHFYEVSTEDRESIFGNNPFGLCAAQLIGTAARILELAELTDESVLYVFDSGDHGEPAFTEAMMDLIRTDEASKNMLRVFGVSPAIKERFAALDMPDIFAWLVNQHHLNMPRGCTIGESSPYLSKVTTENIGHYIAGETLLDLIDGLRPFAPLNVYGRLASSDSGRNVR